ncbi:MAG TPA: 50S ribosomal protein L20 [Candidatus Latescibacteria bacterium]|jgi:large subunit ribosomal protein L20|nr:50S ribosomal protein L20 [Gemmatimonadota bacterium]MBI94178.1 50S ribosomal protein L20 [Gemmatimonadaceae bacterium]MDP7364641.1 50S ribosomal protein L20 [Candidatus Latescibacterota bacterium]MBU07714.1 50S ribosomal protein L20 [Gemmatimonadota bacterium]MDP7633334.1 50S ribosomal protein L20 [Candidatus Latescibacterota bacterium]|tara:strand:- start:1075 stop:1431 length:357 start_codon:yes stop_codon:yes gene_type:complete
MPRTRNSVATRRRRNKVLKKARGYFGARSRLFRTAKEAVDRAQSYAYRDRRRRKRDFRRLWIARINAAARINGISYSQLIHGLGQAEIDVNRKVLADIAVRDPEAFTAIAEQAKAHLS